MIGDCHVTRLQQQDLKYNNTSITFWGRGGQSAAKFDPSKFSRLDIKSSKIEFQEKDTEIPKVKSWSDIKDDGTAIFWLGYIDAKNYLHKYQNADEVAKNYILLIKEYFPNSKIIVIEPHPQFKDSIFMQGENIPVVSYRNRKEQNDLLCQAIRKYSAEFGIDKVITQDQILEAIGLEEITKNEMAGYYKEPNDGLDPKYVEKIYQLILSNIAVD
jgi:hypothetical protein